jgi:hypothetical protein
MTRRRYRPLNMIRTGSPTLEDRTRRPSTRRFYRHLTSGATPPPIPLKGLMRRMMTPAAVSDYASLATATWSTGATGTISGAANSSWNCIYYHDTTANRRTTGINVVMNPIRWSFACPASDGGTYDFWNSSSPLRYLQSGEGGSSIGGFVGMSDTFLVSGHWQSLQDGFAELAKLPLDEQGAQAYPRSCIASGTDFAEATLEAIAAATERCANGTMSIEAIRHRVNGSAVGTLQMNPPRNRDITDAWRVSISEGDTYEIDVWYRLKFTPNASYPTSAGKQCWYIPTTRVSNGSRRAFGVTANYPLAVFRNLDYSPAFNYTTHTYNITISGHSGWTLKDGTDGPHKMISSTGWTAYIQNGTIIWEPTDKTGYLYGIVLRWNREIPQIEFWPGPLSSYFGSSAGSNQPVFYRPATSGYRASTTSTDYSTVTHAPMASFNQSGSTDFGYVEASLDRSSGLEGAFGDDLLFPEGWSSSAVTVFEDLPTQITISRTTQ